MADDSTRIAVPGTEVSARPDESREFPSSICSGSFEREARAGCRRPGKAGSRQVLGSSTGRQRVREARGRGRARRCLDAAASGLWQKKAHGHRKKHGGHHARILQTRKRLPGFRSEAHAGGVRTRDAQSPALPAGDARDRAHPDERDRDPEWVAGRDGGDAEARRPGAGCVGSTRARRHPGSQPFHLEHRLLPRARPLQQPRPVPGRHVSGPGPRRILGGQRQRHRVHLPPAQGRHLSTTARTSPPTMSSTP